MNFVHPRKGQSGIIYCGTRAKTETLARALEEAGHSACSYHGGMAADRRRVVESRFTLEDGLIVVATVAFGMGVDKPDVRWCESQRRMLRLLHCRHGAVDVREL